MRVGFTGTRDGMSQSQKEAFVIKMYDLQPVEFHHGDCLGADSEAHDIVREFFPKCKIIIWPPKIKTQRAFKNGDVLMKPDEYLTRNKQIVDSTDVLLGSPKASTYESPRSGSWYTIRYARLQGKACHVLER